MRDFSALVDASDRGRKRAVNTLNDLYMRVAIAAPLPSGLTLEPTKKEVSEIQLTQNLVTDTLMGKQVGPYVENQKECFDTLSSPKPSPQLLSQTSPNRPRSSWFDRYRRRSSGQDPSLKSTSPRSASIKSDDGGYFRGSLPSHRLSASPLTSPQTSMDGADNPWATEGRSQSNGLGNRSVAKSPSYTASSLTIRPRLSTNKSGSSASTKILSPQDKYGGFCKGAYKLQVGDKDGMKIRNQSIAGTGEDWYWGCCKCAFESRASKKGRDWIIDDAVHRYRNVCFRISFLARSHVMLSKTKDRKYDFGCLFCVFAGSQSGVFHGPGALLEHVNTHSGQSLDDTILKRTRCVKDRAADKSEDFDVNLLPLPPKEADAGANVTYDSSMTGAVSNEELSWTTSGDTMSDTDVWRDAT